MKLYDRSITFISSYTVRFVNYLRCPPIVDKCLCRLLKEILPYVMNVKKTLKNIITYYRIEFTR